MFAYFPMQVGPILVPTYSAAQVRAAEGPLLGAGIPLMTHAAAALAQIALEQLDYAPDAPANGRVLVLVGSGDNGGDALYAAAVLSGEGAEADLVTVGEKWHVAGMKAAVDAGGNHAVSGPLDVTSYDLIIDGIVGIGANVEGGLQGKAAEVVADLAAQLKRVPEAPKVIAVDIPSGLQPDSGKTTAPVLSADITVTMGEVKTGLVVGDGPRVCGQVYLAKLGLGPYIGSETPTGQAEVAGVIEADDNPDPYGTEG